MKKVFFTVVSAILLTSCTQIQGPVGPQGEQGEKGPQGETGPSGETVTYQIYTITGTLDSAVIQWDIPYAEKIPVSIPENAIVNCRIRNGSNGSIFMWREIVFYYNTEILRIMKSEITHIGDEYIITVLIP